MTKKKICMISSWYPSVNNPYKGVFFKEQAFSLEDEFEFLIIHYTEKVSLNLFRKISFKYINSEKNTVEYDLLVNMPIWINFTDFCYHYYRKYIRRNRIEGVGRYISKLHMRQRINTLKRIFGLYIKEDIDCFYCVNAQYESSVLSIASQILNKPYIVAEHAPFPWPGSTLDNENKKAIEKADCFIAISQDKIRQIMLQNVRPKRIFYLGNLIDEEKFVINRKPHEITTFIIVAANSYFKNYDMFINIMNQLKKITERPFAVMIVGFAANRGYSKNVDALIEIIKKSDFYDSCELIPEVNRREICNLYNRADAFVMTSIQEGQPVSALEAACCGLPIFSTRCGGIEDYVTDEVGQVFNLNDVENFACALKNFLEKKVLYDSEKIRKKVVSIYGKKQFVYNFKKLINETIEEFSEIGE